VLLRGSSGFPGQSHDPRSHTKHTNQEKRQIENLRREVVSLSINYPVVTDNDYQTWNAYYVEAWPTIVLLDKRGRIRWMHVGEGDYDRTEQLIQRLLGESNTYAS